MEQDQRSDIAERLGKRKLKTEAFIKTLLQETVNMEMHLLFPSAKKRHTEQAFKKAFSLILVEWLSLRDQAIQNQQQQDIIQESAINSIRDIYRFHLKNVAEKTLEKMNSFRTQIFGLLEPIYVQALKTMAEKEQSVEHTYSTYKFKEQSYTQLVQTNRNPNILNFYLYCSQSKALLKNIKQVRLNIRDIKLTFVDFSEFTTLEKLYLSSNNLASIDLSKNVCLDILYIDANRLKEIDLKSNKKLKYLSFWKNELEGIDLSNNENLTSVCLSINRLKQINLKNNPNLTILHLSSNLFTDVDLSMNPNIIELWCWDNKLNSLTFWYSSQLSSETVKKQWKNLTLGNQNSEKCEVTLLYTPGDQYECAVFSDKLRKEYNKPTEFYLWSQEYYEQKVNKYNCTYEFSLKQN